VWKSSTVSTVVRDLVLLAVGSFGVVHEELTGSASVPLLVVYTTMLGIPGAAGALWLTRAGPGPTELPSPPSPAEPSASPERTS
jgi:hypothetical protein